MVADCVIRGISESAVPRSDVTETTGPRLRGAADHGASPTSSRALPRLLLVEDDRVLGPLLVEVLAENHEVDHAPDGQAGLHLALDPQLRR